MPQMYPMNWMYLFIMFLLILIMFNLLNYFTYNLNIKFYTKYMNNFPQYFNWKW